MLDSQLNDSSAAFTAELLRFGSQSSSSRLLECPIDDRYRIATRTVTGKVLEMPVVPRLGSAMVAQSIQLAADSRQKVTYSSSLSDAEGYAAPLAPLRERDSQVLTSFFAADAIDDIEADVTRYLLLLWPEPCWDEDPFSFLHEYL